MSVVPSPSKPIPDDTPAHESQFMSASLSDGAVQVTHALLSLAPSVCLAEDAVGNVRETFSARQAVYANASLSNKEMFQDLPPVLMHADPRANANKLYGGSRPSPVPHAAYQPGVWGGAPWNERIYFGVALFDLNGESHLAALYTVESTLVCHVYGAPLAELESQLFDVRRPVSLIEKAWLGEPLGNTLRDLRVATGAYLRSQGFGTFPGFLLTGDHHLVRPGVLPLLHLRGYKTDLERERVEQMLFSLLAIQGTADGSAPRCELGETFINVSNVITVFDSCGVPEKDLALPDGADQHIYKMLEVSRCRLMYLVAGYIVQPWNDKLDEATANAAEVMHANVLTVELAQVSEMARAEKHMTLSSITRVVGMCCATGVELIVSIGSMAELVERVSTRLFELSDVVLATRDLVTTVEKEPRSWAHDAFVAIENMARRVASPQVVLIIETDSCHVVGKMKVVNCDTLTEITTVETATRLLFCPWVSALIMHTGADANRSVYTINTRTVERDQLRVTEAIRKAHTAAPSKHSRPIASPGDVDQLRRDINTRLDTMVGSIKALPVVEVVPSAPLPRAESPAVASLRESTTILKRLARKRCHR